MMHDPQIRRVPTRSAPRAEERDFCSSAARRMRGPNCFWVLISRTAIPTSWTSPISASTTSAPRILTFALPNPTDARARHAGGRRASVGVGDDRPWCGTPASRRRHQGRPAAAGGAADERLQRHVSTPQGIPDNPPVPSDRPDGLLMRPPACGPGHRGVCVCAARRRPCLADERSGTARTSTGRFRTARGRTAPN